MCVPHVEVRGRLVGTDSLLPLALDDEIQVLWTGGKCLHLRSHQLTWEMFYVGFERFHTMLTGEEG